VVIVGFKRYYNFFPSGDFFIHHFEEIIDCCINTWMLSVFWLNFVFNRRDVNAFEYLRMLYVVMVGL